MSGHKAHDKGLSLMELVVVMAVFALVATMGLQALTGTLRQRDRLVELDTGTADIARALSLLRADLRAGVSVSFQTPDGQQEAAWTIQPDGNGFALSLSGQQDLNASAGSGLGRAIWQFDAGQGHLTRQSWATLQPADLSAQTPKVVVAGNITGMEIRSFIPNQGWVSGPDPNPTTISSGLPKAIDVIITTRALGRISTLVGHP